MVFRERGASLRRRHPEKTGGGHGCPVELFGQCRIERREPQCNCKYPLPGLVPGIHVLAAGIAKAQKDVDGRVKPGQGDLWLCMDRCRQPVSSTGQPCAAGEDALVPVLWFYEMSAVLSREQNRGPSPRQRQRTSLPSCRRCGSPQMRRA